MFGGRSIKLANVFGIRIGVDPSWFIVLFLAIWWLQDGYAPLYPGDELLPFTLATVTAVLFFLSILLHELGHAFVAVRNGVGISGIDLWLLGGVAKMTGDTPSAGVEFRMAAAGPLVSFVLAVAFAVAAVLSAGSLELALAPGPPPSPAFLVFFNLAFVNGAVVLFNLIPAFPLDGGRILRAIAWAITGDRLRATGVAASAGRIIALAMIGVGIGWATVGGISSLVNGLWLALIGIFIGQAARTSRAQTEFSARLDGLTVADLMDAQPVAVPLGLGVDRVLDEYLLRYGWPWFPVIDEDGRFVGLVTREAAEAIPEADRKERTAGDVMAPDPEGSLRVPVDQPIEALLQTSRDGLARLGALMAVDADGRLRGVVTLQQLRRAIRPPA